MLKNRTWYVVCCFVCTWSVQNFRGINLPSNWMPKVATYSHSDQPIYPVMCALWRSREIVVYPTRKDISAFPRKKIFINRAKVMCVSLSFVSVSDLVKKNKKKISNPAFWVYVTQISATIALILHIYCVTSNNFLIEYSY